MWVSDYSYVICSRDCVLNTMLLVRSGSAKPRIRTSQNMLHLHFCIGWFETKWSNAWLLEQKNAIISHIPDHVESSHIWYDSLELCNTKVSSFQNSPVTFHYYSSSVHKFMVYEINPNITGHRFHPFVRKQPLESLAFVLSPPNGTLSQQFFCERIPI